MKKNTLQSLFDYLKGVNEDYETQAMEFLQAFTVDENDAGTINRFIREKCPSYVSPGAEEQVVRAKLSRNLTERIKASLINAAKGFAGVEGLDENNRDLEAILLPGAENKEKNQKMVNIVKRGTPQQKQDLFQEQIDRMASIDVSEVYQYSDVDLVANFDKLFPILHLGPEAENLAKRFDKLPPEQMEQFNILRDKLCDCFYYFCSRMNNIMNPLYPFVNMDAVDFGTKGLFTNLIDFAAGRKSPAAEVMVANIASWVNERSADMNRTLGADPSNTNAMKFSISADMERDTNYMDAFRKGQTVYGKGPAPDAEVKAYRLYKGPRGDVLKEVPKPVEEPGRVTRFFDDFFRTLGLKGFQSCRDFDQYQADMNRIEREAMNETPDQVYKNVIDSFAAKATAEKKHKDNLEACIKQNADSIKRYRQNSSSEPIKDGLMIDGLISMNAIHQAALDGTEMTPEAKEEHLLNFFCVYIGKDLIKEEKQIAEMKNLIKTQPAFIEQKEKRLVDLSQMMISPSIAGPVKNKILAPFLKSSQNDAEQPEQQLQNSADKQIAVENTIQLP